MNNLKTKIGKSVLKDIVEDIMESISENDATKLDKDLAELIKHAEDVRRRVRGEMKPLEY